MQQQYWRTVAAQAGEGHRRGANISRRATGAVVVTARPRFPRSSTTPNPAPRECTGRRSNTKSGPHLCAWSPCRDPRAAAADSTPPAPQTHLLGQLTDSHLTLAVHRMQQPEPSVVAQHLEQPDHLGRLRWRHQRPVGQRRRAAPLGSSRHSRSNCSPFHYYTSSCSCKSSEWPHPSRALGGRQSPAEPMSWSVSQPRLHSCTVLGSATKTENSSAILMISANVPE